MLNRIDTNEYMRYGLYMLAVLPIFIFRDFTLDNELRYLSIADEALRNGSLFTFSNHGLVYADKPPLYLWIVMLGKLLFGHHSMLFLALFSFIPALVIIWIMNKWVGDALSASERLIAELMLLSSAFFIGSAVVLRMDMLMCMFIVLALYTFFKIYRHKEKAYDSILFPVYVFMALFTKGPMGLLVPLVSIIAFLLVKGEARQIGRYWGWKTLAILGMLCTAWLVSVYAEGGYEYLNNLVFKQTVNRAVNATHHKEPFYYYFIAFLYTIAPWSLLAATLLWNKLKNKVLLTDLELFFAVVSLSTFFMLSVFSSKLAIYLLPALPFVIYLSMLWLQKQTPTRWINFSIGTPSIIFCLVFPAVIIYKYTFANAIDASLPVFLAAFFLSATGLLSLRFLVIKKWQTGIKTLVAGILVSVFTVAFAIPGLNQYIGVKQLCEQADAIAKSRGGVNYYFCEMSRAGNMDVFLNASLTELRKHDLPGEAKIKTPALVFISKEAIEENDAVKQFVRGRKSFCTGNYYCIEIENKKQNK